MRGRAVLRGPQPCVLELFPRQCCKLIRIHCPGVAQVPIVLSDKGQVVLEHREALPGAALRHPDTTAVKNCAMLLEPTTVERIVAKHSAFALELHQRSPGHSTTYQDEQA